MPFPNVLNPFTGELQKIAHSVLTDDDHTIYALLAGRSGGQTINGDTASGGDLTLDSTSHATKGKIKLGSKCTIESTGAITSLTGNSAYSNFEGFGIIGTRNNDAATNFSQIIRKSRGSYASPTVVQNGDKVFQFTGQGHDGTSYLSAAFITMEVDGVPGTNDMPGRIILSTSPDGSGVPVEAVRINNAGNVGIGASATISGKAHIDQSSTTAAIPVLVLDQGDIDDTFVNFIGTVAADGSRSISTDTTEDSTKFGAIRVEINGVTKWIRIYDDHS